MRTDRYRCGNAGRRKSKGSTGGEAGVQAKGSSEAGKGYIKGQEGAP